MDPKEPKEPGADVVSIEDARARALGDARKDAPADEAAAGGESPVVNVDANEFLKPVMAAIARELAGVADPDGTVRVGGSDEASRAKTAAVVKGLGMGLGQALAEAFGKWAQKIETGAPPANATAPGSTPGAKIDIKVDPTPPDEKKPS